jgi:hypothetical protein
MTARARALFLRSSDDRRAAVVSATGQRGHVSGATGAETRQAAMGEK